MSSAHFVLAPARKSEYIISRSVPSLPVSLALLCSPPSFYIIWIQIGLQGPDIHLSPGFWAKIRLDIPKKWFSFRDAHRAWIFSLVNQQRSWAGFIYVHRFLSIRNPRGPVYGINSLSDGAAIPQWLQQHGPGLSQESCQSNSQPYSGIQASRLATGIIGYPFPDPELRLFILYLNHVSLIQQGKPCSLLLCESHTPCNTHFNAMLSYGHYYDIQYCYVTFSRSTVGVGSSGG